jgi:hypothetical protein
MFSNCENCFINSFAKSHLKHSNVLKYCLFRLELNEFCEYFWKILGLPENKKILENRSKNSNFLDSVERGRIEAGVLDNSIVLKR